MSTRVQNTLYTTPTASQVSSCPTTLNFGFIAQLTEINRCQVLQSFLKLKLIGKYKFLINLIVVSRSSIAHYMVKAFLSLIHENIYIILFSLFENNNKTKRSEQERFIDSTFELTQCLELWNQIS